MIDFHNEQHTKKEQSLPKPNCTSREIWEANPILGATMVQKIEHQRMCQTCEGIGQIMTLMWGFNI